MSQIPLELPIASGGLRLEVAAPTANIEEAQIILKGILQSFRSKTNRARQQPPQKNPLP